MRRKKFINLFIFYSAYVWSTSFGGSILPVHFLKEGLNFQQMILGKLFLFLGQIILMLVLMSFRSKKAWTLAFVFYLAYILLSVRIFDPLQFYAANVFAGFAIVLFFVFYNVAHFENTPQGKIGFSSALMFCVGPLINIVAPLASGYLAGVEIKLLWIFSVIFFLAAIYLAQKQEDFQLSYTIKSALAEIKATRWFIFIEGVWEAMIFGIIPIFTLFFIKQPLEYGGFLAYLALVAVAANITLGRFTDKIQKRANFLYPLTIGMSVLTLLFGIATKNLFLWVIFTGVLQFMLPLFWNLSTAMVVDAHPNLRLAMPGREFMLITGRVVGILIVFFSFSLEALPHYVFYVLGSVMLAFPLLLFWNTKVTKKYSYL